jgi:nitrate/nitrite transporter NarK
MPRRVFFADVFTPMRLTDAGLAALPARNLALQQDTDNGLVFRVEADSAEEATDQIIGMVGEAGVIGAIYPADEILASGERIAAIDGALDPRLVPPLAFGPPDEPDEDSGWDWDRP